MHEQITAHPESYFAIMWNEMMHQEITALGWAWHGGCNCSTPGNVYRKGSLSLRHYYKRGTWELKQRNRLVARGADDNLIKTLQEYDEVALH